LNAGSLIPAFAKQAWYFAKAGLLERPPNPPARGAEVTVGLGAAEFDLVAAFAGSTLIVRRPTVARARREFFLEIVMGIRVRHQF
jgi:hypothetical protein